MSHVLHCKIRKRHFPFFGDIGLRWKFVLTINIKCHLSSFLILMCIAFALAHVYVDMVQDMHPIMWTHAGVILHLTLDQVEVAQCGSCCRRTVARRGRTAAGPRPGPRSRSPTRRRAPSSGPGPFCRSCRRPPRLPAPAVPSQIGAAALFVTRDFIYFKFNFLESQSFRPGQIGQSRPLWHAIVQGGVPQVWAHILRLVLLRVTTENNNAIQRTQ